MFDIRYQYALHTTSFTEQPLSDRTLSRFRARCLAYETETGLAQGHMPFWSSNTQCINDHIVLRSKTYELMPVRFGFKVVP